MNIYMANEGEDEQLLSLLLGDDGYDVVILPMKRCTILLFSGLSGVFTQRLLKTMGGISKHEVFFGTPIDILKTDQEVENVLSILMGEKEEVARAVS